MLHCVALCCTKRVRATTLSRNLPVRSFDSCNSSQIVLARALRTCLINETVRHITHSADFIHHSSRVGSLTVVVV